MALSNTWSQLSRTLSGNRRSGIVSGIIERAEKKQDLNRYEHIDYYIENDESLYSSLRFYSLSVGAAYKKYAKDYPGIEKKATSIAYNLLKYGDVVILRKSQEMLPMFAITILDDKGKIGNYQNTRGKYIKDKKFYVLNEADAQVRQIFNEKDVLHLSLNNEGTRVEDIHGRITYSVYSIPPTQPALKYLKWKELLIDNDIMWRDRMVPREHHKMKIDVNLDEYEGNTLPEKAANARKAGELELQSYISSIAAIDAGESYVTTDNIDIDIVETKLNYASPNEMISNITKTIVSSLNVPLSAVNGESSSSYSSELVLASYFMLSANAVIDQVNEYMAMKYPNVDFSDASVMLEVWRTELYKRVSLAAGLNVFTVEELRKMLGFEKITIDKLIAGQLPTGTNVDGRTIDGVVRETDKDAVTPTRDSTRNKKGSDRAAEA